MYTWEQLVKANEIIKTTPVQGKQYAEVNQRIKAFRSICPGGSIITEMVSCENGVCIFRAVIQDSEGMILGTGTAYEKEGSTFINKTSYIENCETSAVGRALGMCGFGIDTSIASAEEVQNAIQNQGDKTAANTSNTAANKQQTPRKRLIARVNELGIAEEVQNAIQNQGDKTAANTSNTAANKQQTPRKRLIARLNELGIDVNAYAAANNLNGKTDPETFERLLKELENA